VGAGLLKLYTALLILQVLCIVIFVHFVFRKPINKVFRVIFGLTFIAPLLLILVAPYGMVDFRIRYLGLLPLVIMLVDEIRSKRHRENPYNILFIITLGIFSVWYPISKNLLNDMLYMQGVVTNIFLVLSQCVMLSVSYAETKRREESLAAHNDFYYKTSHALLTPLTKVSTNVQIVKIKPELMDKFLTESQEEIMKMAEMINKALEDKDAGNGT
jgi:signal transduction histidine kinase